MDELYKDTHWHRKKYKQVDVQEIGVENTKIEFKLWRRTQRDDKSTGTPNCAQRIVPKALYF